jgi:hypothetical protein
MGKRGGRGGGGRHRNKTEGEGGKENKIKLVRLFQI